MVSNRLWLLNWAAHMGGRCVDNNAEVTDIPNALRAGRWFAIAQRMPTDNPLGVNADGSLNYGAE